MSDFEDYRKYAPATQRNREPILQVLQQVLPATGNVLEIASGTGEHAVFLAPFFPGCQWFPSDVDPISCQSIAAWQEVSPSDNLRPPKSINVLEAHWWTALKDLNVSAIININMIHISHWKATLGLMKGAGQLLSDQGILYLYGPYKQEGKHTAPSNQSFDQMLHQQNPEWGVRNLEDVINIAQENHLHLQEIVTMPANNLSVIFQKRAFSQ